VFVPVRIAGPSMAPALLGDHWNARCAACQKVTEIGAEAAKLTRKPTCSGCDAPLDLEQALFVPGQRVLQDRATYLLRDPRRYELVAFRSPQEPGKLAVKRVLGLPGEVVSIRDGELWIDDRLVTKSAREFRDQAVLAGELKPDASSNSQNNVCWSLGDDKSHVTDDLPYNGALSHQLARVDDLALEVILGGSIESPLELRLPGTPAVCRAVLDPTTHTANLYCGDQPGVEAPLPPNGRRIWFGCWDETCELWIDDVCILILPRPQTDPAAKVPAGRAEVVSTAAAPLIQSAHLWRDLYLTSSPDGHPATAESWRLGPDEFFVVGDNQAVSEDSRTWKTPGLPRSTAVGRPWAW
jgi:signal peptidase I